jgi:hypothetical protein
MSVLFSLSPGHPAHRPGHGAPNLSSHRPAHRRSSLLHLSRRCLLKSTASLDPLRLLSGTVMGRHDSQRRHEEVARGPWICAALWQLPHGILRRMHTSITLCEARSSVTERVDCVWTNPLILFLEPHLATILAGMDVTYKVKHILPFFSFSFVWLTKDDEY